MLAVVREDNQPIAGTGGPTAVGVGRFQSAIAVLVAVLAIVASNCRESDTTTNPAASPAAVVLQNAAEVDPAVLALINDHVARVRKSPLSVDAHGNLGLVYEANGFWTEATQCYSIVDGLGTDDYVWSYHRAVTLRESGDTDGALAVLRQLAVARPEVPVIQQRLGESLLEAGHANEASDAFKRVIALSPGSPLGYVGLGDVRLGQGRHPEAKKLLDRALGLDPGYKAARYSLGLVLRSLGRRDEAERELAIGLGGKRRMMRDALSDRLQSYSINLTARLNLARRHKARGRLDEAAEILETLAESHPKNTSVLNNLATVYLVQDRPQEALALLLRVRELDHSAFATFTNLAACCLELDRLAEALDYADKAIEAAPDNSQCHLARAAILTRKHRYDDAVVSLTTAAGLDPKNPAPHLSLGRIGVLRQHHEEARQHFETAVRMAPLSVTAQLNLAATSLTVGRIADASEALTAAEKLDPDHRRLALLKRRLERLQDR